MAKNEPTPSEAMMADALRWAYVRDILWHGVKRGELPSELSDYFYRIEDVKYPNRYQMDEAIDILRMRGQ
jgi:hypothetical protein